MSVYPDTSFLFSLYLPRPTSAAAAEMFAALGGPLPVTGLLLYEFENAARLAAWMNSKDHTKGIPIAIAQTALARLEADLEDGALTLTPCDFTGTLDLARRLSNTHTWRGGHRSFDLFHVAAARKLDVEVFLSFDNRQRKLAGAEGLEVRP